MGNFGKDLIDKVNLQKTFAWRCTWTEYEAGVGIPDGYTYATSKGDLLREISRREKVGDSSCQSRHSDMKVVMIGFGLFKMMINSQRKCFTTVESKHEQDFERIYPNTNSVSRKPSPKAGKPILQEH